MLFPLPKPSSNPLRVVITGAGIVTALGAGWRANAEGFRTGRPAFRPVTLFDVSRHRAKTAAEADLPADLPPSRLSAAIVRRLDRPARMLILAAMEAWGQSGWEAREGLPVVLGTTSGGMSLGETYFRAALETPAGLRGQPARASLYQSQVQARLIGEALGFDGPLTVLSNACASGANAIGHAWDLVRRGRAERVLTGGWDALSLMVFSGFDSLQALSTTSCRPFDACRDGLALGEGAAVLAMEELGAARRRGARILGEVIGYGATIDLHHLTQPQPEGDAALLAMSRACDSAGLGAGDIDYVNAHGTGTLLNDAAEALAINRWAGPRAASLPVSSTKGSVGHLLGAAGAVEAAVCLMALEEQWAAPGTPPFRPSIRCASFPWCGNRLPRGSALC